MEADWEFEVSPDAAGLAAPVIEARWAGFVDLEREPERARDLPEAAQLPGLAEVLIRLNGSASPVWTSKCDVWPKLEEDEFDPDELDAPPGSSAHATGCYIDLLPKDERQWPQPETAAADCGELCRILRAIPLRCCRADLIIRRALITARPSGKDPMRLGVTVYLSACGGSSPKAVQALQGALAALADALSGHSKLE